MHTEKPDKLLCFSLLLSLLMIVSCKHLPQEELTPTPLPSSNNNTNDSVSFQTEILPLIIGNCATTGCHNNITAAKGLILTNYSTIMLLVTPKNINNSELVEVITETKLNKRMPPPPQSALPQDQINLIIKWINEGARNTNIARCDTMNFAFASTIQPIVIANCKGCHNGTNAGGGISLTNYGEIKNSVQNGKFICSIAHSNSCSPMPKGGNKLET
jgi:uncharacterized membrane protein